MRILAIDYVGRFRLRCTFFMTSLTSLVTQMIQELFQRGSNFTAVPICSTLFIQCALLSMFVTKTNKQHQKKKIINEKKK